MSKAKAKKAAVKKKDVKKTKERKEQSKLARVLFEKRVSIQDVQEKSGLHYNTIKKIKQGDSVSPGIDTLRKIAGAISELTGEEIKIEDIF